MTVLRLVLRRSFRVSPLLVGLLCVAKFAAADMIISTGVGSTGPSLNATQFEEQGWTQTQTYNDASISVDLFSWTPGTTFDVTAYLTSTIGSVSTDPPLATMSFSGETQDSIPQVYMLFAGITLAPGTYYLTLSSTDGVGEEPGAIWADECFSGCPVTLASGVALLSQGFVNDSFGVMDGSYAPGSTFLDLTPQLNLTVTGELPPSGMPEPSTFMATISAVAGLLAGRKLQDRRRLSR